MDHAWASAHACTTVYNGRRIPVVSDIYTAAREGIICCLNKRWWRRREFRRNWWSCRRTLSDHAVQGLRGKTCSIGKLQLSVLQVARIPVASLSSTFISPLTILSSHPRYVTITITRSAKGLPSARLSQVLITIFLFTNNKTKQCRCHSKPRYSTQT